MPIEWNPAMSLPPLLNTPIYLQIDNSCAMIAGRRRDCLHRISSYVWTLCLVAVAISSFWICEFALIGPFSPIHLLSVLTLWSLWAGIRNAIAGRISAHRAVFRNLYWYGRLVAGTFNILP